MPLEEYRHRRTALERQQFVLQQRQEQVETQVDQQQALAQVTTALTGFCARVTGGLARAPPSTTFDQRRQLVELLIDRVVVTDGDVEIHYVLPTTPASEHIRFSHLRTDYQHRLPRWIVASADSE
jgi:site-specific DNA recombinase